MVRESEGALAAQPVKESGVEDQDVDDVTEEALGALEVVAAQRALDHSPARVQRARSLVRGYGSQARVGKEPSPDVRGDGADRALREVSEPHVALRVELAEIARDESRALGADDLRDHVVSEAAHPKEARLLGAVHLGPPAQEVEKRPRGAAPQARLSLVGPAPYRLKQAATDSGRDVGHGATAHVGDQFADQAHRVKLADLDHRQELRGPVLGGVGAELPEPPPVVGGDCVDGVGGDGRHRCEGHVGLVNRVGGVLALLVPLERLEGDRVARSPAPPAIEAPPPRVLAGRGVGDGGAAVIAG